MRAESRREGRRIRKQRRIFKRTRTAFAAVGGAADRCATAIANLVSALPEWEYRTHPITGRPVRSRPGEHVWEPAPASHPAELAGR